MLSSPALWIPYESKCPSYPLHVYLSQQPMYLRIVRTILALNCVWILYRYTDVPFIDQSVIQQPMQSLCPQTMSFSAFTGLISILLLPGSQSHPWHRLTTAKWDWRNHPKSSKSSSNSFNLALRDQISIDSHRLWPWRLKICLPLLKLLKSISSSVQWISSSPVWSEFSSFFLPLPKWLTWHNLSISHPDIYLVHPIEVLNHCAKHGYADLASLAARQSLSFPFDRIVKGLTHPGLLGKWVRFAFWL